MRFRNNEHYRRVKQSPNQSVKPVLNKSNWLFFFVGVVIVVATVPYLVVRKGYMVPSTLSEYLRLMTVLGPALFCLMLLLLWMIQFKPYLELKDGRCYVGKFEISNKSQILRFCFLKLSPGKKNWIKVNEKIFRSLKIGETIELTRTAFGGIISVKKIPTISQRISKHKKYPSK